MSSQSGLSGLNAASHNLDVIGNNIANANTIGMKSSRVEFSDLIASTSGGGGGVGGIGVGIAAVSQLFTQGNVNVTGRDMDVAINGNGFFQLTMPDGSSGYTRDGQFKLDKVGNLITNGGAHVMGYPTDKTGVATSTTPVVLQLPTAAPIAANPTTEIGSEFNLDSRAPVITLTAADPIPTTYGTALTVFDSQGASVPLNLYFVKVASALTDDWNVYNKTTAGTASLFTMKFDADGVLTSPATSPTLTINTPSAVTPDISATLDISKVTQYGAAFSVSNLTQNGYAPGELVGIKIADNGVITGSYSNGQTQANGQIALADFRNVQGMSPRGGGVWVQSVSSGLPIQGAPGIGRFGALRAGAVEESNVDLTAELVNMMTAQRAYQANAQTIKTQDQATQTIVNMR